MCILGFHAWDPCCYWLIAPADEVVIIRSICARPGCRTSRLERFR